MEKNDSRSSRYLAFCNIHILMAVKTTNIKFFVSEPIALPVENKKTERKTKYIFASKLPEDCFILFYNKPNQTSNKAFSSNKTERDHPKNSRSEEHTSELQSRFDLVCRLLLEK